MKIYAQTYEQTWHSLTQINVFVRFQMVMVPLANIFEGLLFLISLKIYHSSPKNILARPGIRISSRLVWPSIVLYVWYITFAVHGLSLHPAPWRRYRYRYCHTSRSHFDLETLVLMMREGDLLVFTIISQGDLRRAVANGETTVGWQRKISDDATIDWQRYRRTVQI